MNNKQIEDLVDLMFDTDMEEVMKEKSTLEYIHKLQQENKQLKEEIARLKEWKEDLLNENIELENIRKEAIEYINTHYLNANEPKLLEILGDKE